MKCEGSQEDEYDTHGSGDDRSRMVEFRVECQHTDRQENEGDIRVQDVGENAELQSHRIVADRLAGEIQSCGPAIEALETLSAHLAEQILLAGSHIVDQLLV